MAVSVKAGMRKSPWSQGEEAFAELVIPVTWIWAPTLRFRRGLREPHAGPTSNQAT